MTPTLSLTSPHPLYHNYTCAQPIGTQFIQTLKAPLPLLLSSLYANASRSLWGIVDTLVTLFIMAQRIGLSKINNTFGMLSSCLIVTLLFIIFSSFIYLLFRSSIFPADESTKDETPRTGISVLYCLCLHDTNMVPITYFNVGFCPPHPILLQ